MNEALLCWATSKEFTAPITKSVRDLANKTEQAVAKNHVPSASTKKHRRDESDAIIALTVHLDQPMEGHPDTNT